MSLIPVAWYPLARKASAAAARIWSRRSSQLAFRSRWASERRRAIALEPAALSDLVLSDLVLSDLVLSDLVLSDLVLSDLVLSDLVLSDLVLSDLAVPDPLLSFPALSNPAVSGSPGLNTSCPPGYPGVEH
jgi:hypothetical protein